MIGDRWGDRLQTTYHRSESMMNKGIRKVGDRLKEDFRFFIWKGYGCPKPNPPRITIESACWIYITSSIYFHISTTFKKICISLSYAFCSSAWWNWQKAFLFPNGVKVYYLSFSKIATFSRERWYSRYSTWTAIYQHIRKRCVIYKRLTWVSVVIIIFWEGFARPWFRIMVQQHSRLFCVRSVMITPKV